MFNIQHFACHVYESYQFSAAHVVLEVFPLEPGPKTCLKLHTSHFTTLHTRPSKALQVHPDLQTCGQMGRFLF